MKNLTRACGRRSDAEAARAEAFMAAKMTGSFASQRDFNEFSLRHAAANWSSCAACPLSLDRTQVVFGDGDPEAEVLVVAEAPGETEDLEGIPLVGPSGAIFRRAAGAPSVDLLSSCYLTNRCACRPPKNRKPDKEELAACLPRVLETAAILRPRVVLLLGGVAASWFGIKEVGVNRGIVPRSSWPIALAASGRLRAVVLTWHPSYVLHQESRVRKKTAFAQFVGDLKLTKRALDQVRRTEPKAAVALPTLEAAPEDSYGGR